MVKLYYPPTELVPLNAPFMPPIDPMFLKLAAIHGESQFNTDGSGYGPIITNIIWQALYSHKFSIPVPEKGTTVDDAYFDAKFSVGHVWGENLESYLQSFVTGDALPVTGPKKAKVMVIGKSPSSDEVSNRRLMTHATGTYFVHLTQQAQVKNATSWYLTNAIKFAMPEGHKVIRPRWMSMCAHLLQQELRIVRPDYILCLGVDAARSILGKNISLREVEEKVIDFPYSVAVYPDDIGMNTAKVFCCISPANAAISPDKERTFLRQLTKFNKLVRSKGVEMLDEHLNYEVITEIGRAEEVLTAAKKTLVEMPRTERLVACDAEWHGRSPLNPSSYIRTIQLSWEHAQSVCFRLRSQDASQSLVDAKGVPRHKKFAKMLREFLTDTRIVGHFFYSDLEWLEHFGFNILDLYAAPVFGKGTKKPWDLLREGYGGLDTSAASHAIEETAMFGLEHVVLRHTDMPHNYDSALNKFRDAYCAEHGIAKAEFMYGWIPNDILEEYANRDTDATRRAIVNLLPKLDSDYDGKNCWEPFWASMVVQPAILSMRQTGMLIDKKHMAKASKVFHEARDGLIAKLRSAANWETFNPRSLIQFREFLFGEEYNGKLRKSKEVPRRVRPSGAISLGLTPIQDTSKPPKSWAKLVQNNATKGKNPSTNKANLALLAVDNIAESSTVQMLADFRFIDQVCKTVLRSPKITKQGTHVVDEETGELVYEKGLASCIDVDGRVRTFLSTTAETARWKSSNPNMMNWSKSRDKDYSRILGEEVYRSNKLRSMVVAPPGWYLVEADFVGAEVFVAAVMSSDPVLLDHSRRSGLEEGVDPDYYDVHSNIAVMAFNLACQPTKSALKAAGLEHYRNLAKIVLFGLMYGRGAKALAMQANSERKVGTPEVSVEEADGIIKTIFAMYPSLEPYYQDVREVVSADRVITNSFNRHRRFAAPLDSGSDGEMQRQAMNFPIQSTVADALDRSIAYMEWARSKYLREHGSDLFLWQLPIHDAVLILVRPETIEYVVNTLLPWAMRDKIPLRSVDPRGVPRNNKKYYLSISVDVYSSWGKKLSEPEMKKLGINKGH